MGAKLLRVGTIYLPVGHVEISSCWYEDKLGAELTYKDEDKAILNLADQSVFLVHSKEGQRANFIDSHGQERFSLTFEVDGLEALADLHKEYREKGMNVENIENRGHAGRNFVFSDLDHNSFDVWSELSPRFKENR